MNRHLLACAALIVALPLFACSTGAPAAPPDATPQGIEDGGVAASYAAASNTATSNAATSNEAASNAAVSNEAASNAAVSNEAASNVAASNEAASSVAVIAAPLTSAGQPASDAAAVAVTETQPASDAAAIAAGPEPGPQPNVCTLSVRCDVILDNLDKLNREKKELVPADGVIFYSATAAFTTGESVFDLLRREMRQAKIHFEFVNTPGLNASYIKGINNIYEFDCGDLSGWTYKVNGVIPDYSCSLYKLLPGDDVEILYTCDLGFDVGGAVFS